MPIDGLRVMQDQAQVLDKGAQDLRLSNRVGHRRVSTIRVDCPFTGPYETMVFGGKDGSGVAYAKSHGSFTEAIIGHLARVEHVREHPESYDLRRL